MQRVADGVDARHLRAPGIAGDGSASAPLQGVHLAHDDHTPPRLIEAAHKAARPYGNAHTRLSPVAAELPAHDFQIELDPDSPMSRVGVASLVLSARHL